MTMETTNNTLDIDQKKLVETPVSPKGMAPAMSVYKHITDRYPNTGFGQLLSSKPLQRLYAPNVYSRTYFIRPSDVINARAGDPEYTSKAFQEIKNYLDSNSEYYRVGPANHNNSLISKNTNKKDPRFRYDLVKDPIMQQTWNMAYRRHKLVDDLVASGGTYKSKTDNEFMFNPSQAYTAANTPLPVQFNYAKSITHGRSSAYIPIEHSVEIIDDTIPYDRYKQRTAVNVPEIKYPTEDSILNIKPGTLIAYTSMAGGNPTLNIPYVVGHELNHAAQMAYPISTRSVFNTDTLDDDAYYNGGYATDPDELSQAAAAFQQQHYRNTGSRIKDPNKFEDEINKAVNNINDYDYESRRFLDYVRYNKSKNPSLYNSIKKRLPLISQNNQLPGYDTNYKHNMVG